MLVKTAAAVGGYEEAEKRLGADIPGWDFDGIHRRAREVWARLLRTIEIKGGTDHERTLFYSNLFHSFASLRLVARQGEPFRGFDGRVKTADHDRYGPVPFWDTGRDQVVLLTLVEPAAKVNTLRSTIEHARETGFMPTSFHGDHAVWMFLGDWLRGIRFDYAAAYYYDWSGQPWKTQAIVRKILTQLYGSDKYGFGFPGMDDQGSTSSWYALSAMGFFPVDPATENYAIGSPIFDEVTLHLGNGKDFVIVANNNSAANVYIQSATLSGKPLNRPWFTHSEIANGGKLVLNMGAEPNPNRGSAPDAAPPSM